MLLTPAEAKRGWHTDWSMSEIGGAREKRVEAAEEALEIPGARAGGNVDASANRQWHILDGLLPHVRCQQASEFDSPQIRTSKKQSNGKEAVFSGRKNPNFGRTDQRKGYEKRCTGAEVRRCRARRVRGAG